MKKGIHPEYKEANVVCVCGESFTTGSTLSSIHVDICSRCPNSPHYLNHHSRPRSPHYLNHHS
ncbi:MAG: 50S ribosomal protein L31, partial [Candidatus Mariimomonas ferrooxydans]